jgi:clan AA aspartic protease (TIGR02281 family)
MRKLLLIATALAAKLNVQMDVKKLLLAGSALLALSVPAYAESYWSSFSTVGDPRGPNPGAPTCGITYEGGRAIYLKYIKGHSYLEFQVFKPGWHGTYHTPMRIFIDDWLAVNAANAKVENSLEPGKGVMTVYILERGIALFLEKFAEADHMWVRFDAGYEGMWHADMRGSRDAVNAFKTCVANLNIIPPPPTPPPVFAKTPPTPPPVIAKTPPVHDSVPIFSDAQGTSVSVDVILSGYPVRMVLDTGASQSVVTFNIAKSLVQAGGAHWLGQSKSVLADGQIVDIWNISINELRIGNHALRNVLAMVTKSDTAAMLLGFATLNQIGSFTIDTRAQELVFNAEAQS